MSYKWHFKLRGNEMRMELDNMPSCESESRQNCVFLCQAELGLHNGEWVEFLSADAVTQQRWTRKPLTQLRNYPHVTAFTSVHSHLRIFLLTEWMADYWLVARTPSRLGHWTADLLTSLLAGWLSKRLTYYHLGRAIAQVVSRWLPTAAARFRAWVRSCGICGGQSCTGAGFIRVLRFPCQFSFHQLLHNNHHLSSGAATIGQYWLQCQVHSVSPHYE
jgi:hypothetical protein